MADELERALLLRDLELMGQPRNPNAVQPGRAGLLDVGVGLPERLSLLNQIFNPVEAIGQSMNAGERMMSPNMGVMDRLAALGDMASGIAGVVAPVAAASRAGTPAATALMEGLLGGSPTQEAFGNTMRAVGRDVVDRLNQPGQMPTVYSNPILGAGLPPMRPSEEILDLPDDDFVTLYHGTTREAAEKIRQTGELKSAGEPSVYLTTDPSGAGYGDGTVVPVRVRRGLLQIDDEFPSGRTDFRIDLSRPGGSVPVQIAEPPQAPSLPAPRTDAEAMARDILQLRAEGRAGEVTNQMMAAADPQYMYFNTPLPMDAASRMARAEEMGKVDSQYHATLAGFPDFMPSETGLTGRGVYSGDFPTDIEDYARKQGTSEGLNIIPLLAPSERSYARRIDWQNLVDADEAFPWSATVEETIEGFKRAAETMSSQGYSGVRSQPGERVTFDPSNIRSRFARFDPEFRNLSNLSASLAAAGVPLGLLAMLPEEEQY